MLEAVFKRARLSAVIVKTGAFSVQFVVTGGKNAAEKNGMVQRESNAWRGENNFAAHRCVLSLSLSLFSPSFTVFCCRCFVPKKKIGPPMNLLFGRVRSQYSAQI